MSGKDAGSSNVTDARLTDKDPAGSSWFSLSFSNANLEAGFRAEHAHWMRTQMRLAMTLSVTLYIVHWYFDFHLPPDQIRFLAFGRLLAVLVSLLVIVATFRPWFSEHGNRVAFLVAIFGACQLTSMTLVVPDSQLLIYFPLLMLMVGWCSYFSGLRFLPGVLASLVVIGIAWTLFQFRAIEFPVRVGMLFMLVAIFGHSAFAAHHFERARRALYLRTRDFEAQARLSRHLSMHDPLTGLPNRTFFEKHISKSLDKSLHRQSIVALMFIDLDGFKPINDIHGHGVGDLVLREVGKRLRESLRRSDFVARIGGDEFLLLVDRLDSPGDINAIVEELLRKLQQPLRIPYNRQILALTLNASIGVSFGHGSVDSPLQMVRQADLAMYEAKSRGAGSFCIYRPNATGSLWQGGRVSALSKESPASGR